MFRVDSFETICVLSPSSCGAISGMAHLAQAVKSQSCDKEIKVDSFFMTVFENVRYRTGNECKHWVYPINQDRDVVYFLSGPKFDLK